MQKKYKIIVEKIKKEGEKINSELEKIRNENRELQLKYFHDGVYYPE